FFVENLGYTLGFVIVILAHQQLFTENTLTTVLPFMHKPTRHNFGILMRLWSVVPVGNLTGTALMVFAFIHQPVFDVATRAAFVTLSAEVMTNIPGEMFCNAIISGWIIASLVWMMPSVKHNKLLIIILMTYLMGIGDLTHIGLC
ncbi:formate/nitrite transporter family protein, partial [Sodalis-like symbiont of Bactericera trigonica]